MAMPRHASKSEKPHTGRGGSTFIGILIGLVLGLAIALGVAWYINKLPNPFREKAQPPLPPKVETPAPKPAEPAPVVAEKPKLTAQEMLTKGETAAAPVDKAAVEKVSTPAAKEAFFLQTGSFQNAPDADNLKARLALLGLEAAIQTRTLPEKGVWHRVRVGPYTDVEELNRVREVLKQNNIETALVKVREADK
jgi:cell division protein FtsN